jgi:hypothetical protein
MESRARWAARALLVAAVVLAATACPGKLPPVASVGDPIVGPNPQTPGTPGARTTVVTFGSWIVPAANGPGHDQAGMVTDVKFNTRKACSDCYITAARAQLRYLDGTVANTDTGLWLHHFAQADSGGVDAQCGSTIIQQLGGEIFFTGANERSQGRFPAGSGYRVRPTDRWSLLIDLMNTSNEAKQVRFEMTYEWVPATTPNMIAGKPVFMDVGQACVDSTKPAQTGQYSYANTWTVTTPGRVMGAAGHMHDGGTHVTLKNLTTGELICDSKAYYGGPGFEEPMPDGDGHNHDGAGGHSSVHISAVDQCVSRGLDKPIAIIKRGQQLEVAVYYDAALHPQMGDEPVMGLAFMYLLPEG